MKNVDDYFRVYNVERMGFKVFELRGFLLGFLICVIVFWLSF